MIRLNTWWFTQKFSHISAQLIIISNLIGYLMVNVNQLLSILKEEIQTFTVNLFLNLSVPMRNAIRATYCVSWTGLHTWHFWKARLSSNAHGYERTFTWHRALFLFPSCSNTGMKSGKASKEILLFLQFTLIEFSFVGDRVVKPTCALIWAAGGAVFCSVSDPHLH